MISHETTFELIKKDKKFWGTRQKVQKSNELKKFFKSLMKEKSSQPIFLIFWWKFTKNENYYTVGRELKITQNDKIIIYTRINRRILHIKFNQSERH